MNGKRLFSPTKWHDTRDSRLRAVRDEINRLDEDRLLNSGVDILCQYFQDKNQIELPRLDRDSVSVDMREVQREVNDYGQIVTVTGTVVDVEVPFEGPADAFQVQPTSFHMNLPPAVVARNALHFSVQADGREKDQIRSEIDRTLDQIEKNLANLQRDVERFQPEVERLARETITQRREKVLSDRSLVSSLGFKLKERADAPRTYAPPDVRRKVRPQLPPTGGTPLNPEPALPEEDYNHILSVLNDMALTMERSPSAFQTLDEEALRFQFLIPLNGHYEGKATGETFNYEGKSDILIRIEGRNIFVAECKFWGGPKTLTEAIDQLLGYACWRDTKTALLVFNRNKNFSKVLESILETVSQNPNCVQQMKRDDETSFRFVFRHRDDPDREVTLTVLAFDVPRPD